MRYDDATVWPYAYHCWCLLCMQGSSLLHELMACLGVQSQSATLGWRTLGTPAMPTLCCSLYISASPFGVQCWTMPSVECPRILTRTCSPALQTSLCRCAHWYHLLQLCEYWICSSQVSCLRMVYNAMSLELMEPFCLHTDPVPTILFQPCPGRQWDPPDSS